LKLIPEKLAEPFEWTGSRTVFVNSMSDLFQPGVPDDYIEDVVEIMVEANWHTYQVLTKRSDRLQKLLSTKLRFAVDCRHIWWGVSVEDKRYGLPRVDDLRRTPAAARFLSVEPLLEDIGDFDISGIDWVIVGGESGHDARPMEKAWVERILHLCRDASTFFFFKQWGGVHKSKAGRMLNDRTYDEMPERVVAPIPAKAVRQQASSRIRTRAARWQPSELVALQPAACS
jgi:protein gp37